MGVIIKNEVKYCGGTEQGGSFFDFTTEEQVVGKWIDGKPVYRRCFELELDFVTGSTKTQIDKVISQAYSEMNVKKVIDSELTINDERADYTISRPLCFVDNGNTNRFGYLFNYSATGEYILRVYSTAADIYNAVLIMYYTKRTD